MTNREMQVRSMTFGFIGLGVGLLVGIGVLAHNASAQSRGAAPIPGAIAPQQGGHYQYMCLGNLDSRLYAPEVQAKLNEMGEQGWRFLEAGTGSLDQYCFERR